MNKIEFLSIFSMIILLLNSCCEQKQEADLIVINAKVYTLDENFSKQEAFAIREGRILMTGKTQEILKKFSAQDTLDLHGKTVYPGFMDAHCHFYGLGETTIRWADLKGVRSMDEIIKRLKLFIKENPQNWLLGRGWDQNLFPDKNFPNNVLLEKNFPNIPVVLVRVDGHAVLANNLALQLAGISAHSNIDGGEIITYQGKPTGLLLDNATEKLMEAIPAMDKQMMKHALQKAESICVSYGLTTINDAGLPAHVIHSIDELQKNGDVKIRIVAMINPDSLTISEYMNTGIYKTDRLLVNAVKLYADGALGSRGALLKKPYADDPHNHGILVESPEVLKKICLEAYQSGFQVCTHAIGDSANALMLDIYAEILKGKNDRRWRIEHAQVVDPEDLPKFREFSIIPSVQPSHATSDMNWAEKRLGLERLEYAYAYYNLLVQNGWIALGTDFPVEEVNPILTFYAATTRKNLQHQPEGGFLPQNKLSRLEALYGMTLWAAKSTFLENEIGSLEPGKKADFIVTSDDLMLVPDDSIPHIVVEQTWINGECVFHQ